MTATMKITDIDNDHCPVCGAKLSRLDNQHKLLRARVAELEAILGKCVEVIDFNYMDGYQVPPELAEARAVLAKGREG